MLRRTPFGRSQCRKSWLSVGSQQAGERAGSLLSSIESAKLNGHDPWAYLNDVFERLPILKNRDLARLLPHNGYAPVLRTDDSGMLAKVAGEPGIGHHTS